MDGGHQNNNKKHIKNDCLGYVSMPQGNSIVLTEGWVAHPLEWICIWRCVILLPLRGPKKFLMHHSLTHFL